MEIFWRGLLIGCMFTVVCSEDAVKEPPKGVYEDEIVAAEDHEHHRIIIVVPKEVPHHVNHVHTYKLADKGIPLIHSGKVVHDHNHNGKVTHEHGHAGKSTHSHKHSGAYGHQHKHLGHLGHKHVGHVSSGGGGGGHAHFQQPEHPLLRTAAQKLHLHQGYLQQGQYQHAGDYSAVDGGRGGGRPVSGHVQFVPSSRPQGLGSFMPAEIVDGRHGVVQQQAYVQSNDGSPYNVIQLQVPDQRGPNVVKHVDIDLSNNVAKLQTNERQRPVSANFKTLTQYNKVIGYGRAVPSRDDELDGQSEDEDGIGGGAYSLEDDGYRFGEGYRLAMDSGDFSAAQEQDEEEVDEFKEPPAVSEDEESFGQAYGTPF